MTVSTLFWFVVFGISAALFFTTAAVITVIGIRDLRDLLRKSERNE